MSEIVLEPVDEYRYRIPRNKDAGMRTDVLVFSSRALVDQFQKDQSLAQAMNVAALPGIVGPSLAMPDIHQGYGFPIGGVAAIDIDEGVVSPGGVGFDIDQRRPGCRNGIRRRLKHAGPKGHVGSTPTPGTADSNVS